MDKTKDSWFNIITCGRILFWVVRRSTDCLYLAQFQNRKQLWECNFHRKRFSKLVRLRYVSLEESYTGRSSYFCLLNTSLIQLYLSEILNQKTQLFHRRESTLKYCIVGAFNSRYALGEARFFQQLDVLGFSFRHEILTNLQSLNYERITFKFYLS